MKMWHTLLLLLMTSVYSGNEDTPSRFIWCKTNPVEKGGVAAIHCYFPVDANKSRLQIILKKCNNLKKELYDDIAHCDWHEGQEKPDCHTQAKGFDTTASTVRTNVTFFIPDVKPLHFGTYWCELLSETYPIPSENCTLTERYFEDGSRPTCTSFNWYIIGGCSLLFTIYLIMVRRKDLDLHFARKLLKLLRKCGLSLGEDNSVDMLDMQKYQQTQLQESPTAEGGWREDRASSADYI